MTHEDTGQIDQASLPLTSKSLLQNVLESVVDQTLDHLENHPNLYSINDVNTLHTLSNKFNERVQAIQKKITHPTSDALSQISPSKTFAVENNDRETNVSDAHSGEPIHWDEKQSHITKAQHEQETMELIANPEFKERKRFQFIRRNISSIFPEQRKIKALEGLIIDKADRNSDIDQNENWKQMAVDAFNIIDKNGDGFLQREEVIAAIKVIGDQGMDISGGKDPAEVADIMMSDVDLDGDGLIDINEFVEMMRRNVDAEKGSTKIKEFNHRMSQLARNVIHAHQRKIENNVIGRDLWMIHPYGNTHAVWDTLVSFLILLNVVTMPLCLGWDEVNSNLFELNLVIDILFLFDVWKNFCTGIVDDNEAIIMDKNIVRRQYLTGFFIPDLLSSIPLDLILKLSGQSGSNIGAVSSTKNTLKMLKIMRLAKLFRLLRINRLFRQLKEILVWVEETLHFHVSEGFMKMLRLGIFALVMGHWIGCFNFMLVRLNNFPSDSWAVYADLKDRDAFTQWSWSLFKALSEMIMLGFQTPPFTNSSCDAISEWCTIENWVTLMCLYLGAVFYSLLISSVSSILETANIASRHFEEKLIQLDDYMRSKRLPSTLREKVKDYFHLIHSKGKIYNENEIHAMLTPILSRQIKVFTGNELAVKVPLLSAIKNRGFAEEISTMIEPMIVFDNEVIIRERTTGDELFFISSGVVEIFITHKDKVVSYIAIGDGCYFGEVSLLLGMQRTASAKTKTQCMLYRLSKVKFMVALHDYPETLEFMKRVAERRLRRLQHFVNPAKVPFRVEDEVDEEDSKTELFGVDTTKLVTKKEEEATKARSRKMSKRYATIQKHPFPIPARR